MIISNYLSLAITLFLLCFSVQAQRIYVDSASVAVNPDGSSWAMAFPDLQSAIDTAQAGDSIWVAKGTYFPTVRFNVDSILSAVPRERTFYLNTDSVKLLGGFSGVETQFSQRNVVSNPTVLSGDLDTLGDNTDNAYHVMFIDGASPKGNITRATLIDGFIITGGNANATFPSVNAIHSRGAGIYLRGTGNGNEASITMSNCIVQHNEAGDNGGGMFYTGSENGNSDPILINCEFNNNKVDVAGGAIASRTNANGTSNLTLNNCIFFQNDSRNGGAISSLAASSGKNSLDLRNCTITKNTNGAIIFSAGSSTSRLIISNCIIWRNISGSDSLSLAAQIDLPFINFAQISHSLVSGITGFSQPPPTWVNNLAVDPRFVNSGTGDLRLQATSPAINSGNNDSIAAGLNTDIVGTPRIQGRSVDIGAYEGDKQDLTRIYVDSTSTATSPDGSSWSNAYPDLQQAIEVATKGDSIWVAKGTYVPSYWFDANSDFRYSGGELTFYINIDSLKLFGGFSGSEMQVSQRNPSLHSSVLNGGGVNHVVYIDGTSSRGIIHNSTMIDGFSITKGNARDFSGINSEGGGIYIDGAGPGNAAAITVNNCIFSENKARRGGGAIFNESDTNSLSPSIFSNCTFANNEANSGGAVRNIGYTRSGSPSFIDCIFIQNFSADGGAVFNSNGFQGVFYPSFHNCLFEQNITRLTSSGGGDGAAVFNVSDDGECSPVFSSCTFKENRSGDQAGAMFNFAKSGICSPSIVNCVFDKNAANRFGGALYNSNDNVGTCSPEVTNCTFNQNTARRMGGAVFNITARGICAPVFTNCSFSQNRATEYGGGIFNNGSGDGISLTLANCIMWGNVADNDSVSLPAQINDYLNSQSQITNCIVNGIDFISNPPVSWINNANVDPLFVDPDGGDLRLQEGSPALDAGDNDSIPPTLINDLAGNPRIQNATVDLGAFEGTAFKTTRLYVDSASTAITPDGSSWSRAFSSLQEALDVAQKGFSIWVAKGTYFPTTEFDADTSGGSDARERTFYLNQDSIKIYGGFKGTESIVSKRNSQANLTILSGDLGIVGDTADNAYHVVYIDGTSSNGPISHELLIDGFTITSGHATGNSQNRTGGGIYVNGAGKNSEASPTILGCIFTRNHAEEGGAIYTSGADQGRSFSIISNCLLYQNTADSTGSAMVNNGDSIGICSPTLINCTFSENRSAFGAAIENQAQAGVSSPIITNCIIWNNARGTDSTSFAAQVTENGNAQSLINYSLVNGIDTLASQPTSWGNNLAVDPLFISPIQENYAPIETSPAIDAGNKDSLLANTFIDLAGNIRIRYDQVDLGAFEEIIPTLKRIYVDSASTALKPNGATWDRAFPHLQDAIDIATGGDSIWVANGTYFPTDRFNLYNSGTIVWFRDSTFYLQKDSVKIFGGFAGNESAYVQRDITDNPTILSGDVGVKNDSSDNAYSVLIIDAAPPEGIISSETLIDGFTITKGYADNSNSFTESQNSGGGIYINGGVSRGVASPTIRNCSFVENYAVEGGGAIFIQDRIRGTALPRIIDCSFLRNSTRGDGGAIGNITHTSSGSINITNCTFSANNALAGQGGAIYNGRAPFFVNDSLTNIIKISGCTFQDNFATLGGAIYNRPQIRSQITSCRFICNVSTSDGSAIFTMSAYEKTSVNITNCMFTRNQSFAGGTIYTYRSGASTTTPTITNSTFGRNNSQDGGVIFNEGFSNGTSSPTLSNCILWHNRTGSDSTSFSSQVSDNDGARSTLIHCLANGLTTGTGNLSADPLFVDVKADDLRLKNGSPAINAGLNNSIPTSITTDLAGNARIQGGTVDMGAFEGGMPINIDPATTPLAALKAYPNPVTDQFTIEWEVKPSEVQKGQNFTAQLYDLQGRMIRSYSLSASQHVHVLDLSDLPANLYTLKVAGWSVKVVKH